MFTLRVVSSFLTMLAFVGWASAQDPAASPAPASAPAATPDPATAPSSGFAAAQIISLTVPQGTSFQIVLDKEVRVQKVGQLIHGRVVQPVYAFDRLVVPVGAEVIGQIAKIERISGKQRTLSTLNANFTPSHKIDVEFNDLVLAEGKHIHLHTVVTPGSGQVMQLVTAG